MTECPLERHTGFPCLQEESVEDFVSHHPHLSVRGKRVLDRLLLLLPSQLKSQDSQRPSRASPLPPALLFSICDALQADRDDNSAAQDELNIILPSVLSKLRDWRLLDAGHRYGPGGVYKLALDLAGVIDEAPASVSSDLNRASHARLRLKWVGPDLLDESQGRESSPSPSPPLSSRSTALDSGHACAHALPDLNNPRSYEFCQAGRLGAPDSEGVGTAVSLRPHSGFRSGCSACRHMRLSGSGPVSTLSIPRKASVPFNDITQFDTNICTMIPPSRYPKSSAPPTTPRKAKRVNHRPSQTISRGTRADENEPPLPKPVAAQGTGISFPRQRTHSPRISNAILPRDPFSPAAASVQRRSESGRSHYSSQPRQGDKQTTSHRLASDDLRLSMVNVDPRSNPSSASPSDLHPNAPTRAQSFSCAPDSLKSHGHGSVGIGPKLSSNAGSLSSKQLPSWSQTHRATTTTTTTATSSSPPSVTPTRSPAKTGLSNPHSHVHLLPLGGRSRLSSTSIPRHLPSDVKHRDRRSVSSQTHKHTSGVSVLPFSPTSSSPLIHARKWQA